MAARSGVGRLLQEGDGMSEGNFVLMERSREVTPPYVAPCRATVQEITGVPPGYVVMKRSLRGKLTPLKVGAVLKPTDLMVLTHEQPQAFVKVVFRP